MRCTPCADGPHVVAVELLGLAVTPMGAHQPPEDGPLSQRTVLKPSSKSWRFEYAPERRAPMVLLFQVFEIRNAPRGVVLPERSL
jgi:hypothetical protein